MKLDEQSRVREKPAGGARRQHRAARDCTARHRGLRVFRKALFRARTLVFCVSNGASRVHRNQSVVLGFWFEKTGRGILGFFRTAKPMTASQGHIQNEQQSDFLRFPMISRAVGVVPLKYEQGYLSAHRQW